MREELRKREERRRYGIQSVKERIFMLKDNREHKAIYDFNNSDMPFVNRDTQCYLLLKNRIIKQNRPPPPLSLNGSYYPFSPSFPMVESECQLVCQLQIMQWVTHNYTFQINYVCSNYFSRVCIRNFGADYAGIFGSGIMYIGEQSFEG